MYYYLLESGGMPEAEFQRQQVSLAALTHEFNISGETGRVDNLRSIKDLIIAAGRRQSRTLVICGNDDTFNRVLALLGGSKFVIGYVPFAPNSQLASLLGMDSLRSAVKILAARRLSWVDAAKIGDAHFFSYLEFGWSGEGLQKRSFLWPFRGRKELLFSARVDRQYTITAKCLGGLILNARGWPMSVPTLGDPTDGWLDLVVAPASGKVAQWQERHLLAAGTLDQLRGASFLHIKSLEIFEPHGLPLTMLGRQVARVPATVSIIPQYFQMIVGKDRTF